MLIRCGKSSSGGGVDKIKLLANCNPDGMFGNNRIKATDLDKIHEHYDTSLVVSYRKMFCNITDNNYGGSADLSEFDFSSGTDYRELFSGSSAVTEVIFPDGFMTDNTLFCSAMFNGCSGLRTASFKNCVFPSDISQLLRSTYSLKNLSFIDCDFTKVTSATSAFRDCNLSDSEIIYSMAFGDNEINFNEFLYSSSITSFDFSRLRAKTINSAGSMFRSCSKLRSVDFNTFPSKLKGLSDYMLSYCNMLTELINISGNYKNATNISYLFLYSFAIGTELLISDIELPVCTNVSHVFDNTNIESIVLRDIVLGSTAINSIDANSVFINNSKLLSIELSNIVGLHVKQVNNAFANCAVLERIDLSGCNFPELTTISRMFENCSSLKFIDFSNWNTRYVTDMNNIFYEVGKNQYLDTKVKIWVPNTFTAHKSSTKPFNYSVTHVIDVYTDATDANSMGWGNINSKFVMHYNSTHEEFLNA